MQPNQVSSQKLITIVLSGGGTGGHITPLLSLAHALKKADPRTRIIYIGLKGGELENRLQSHYQGFDETYFVQSGKFRRYHGESFLAHLIDVKTIALNIRDFLRVMVGIWQSMRLLKKLKPSVVFCKGGYVIVPVGIAARRLKLPIVTHDSDAVPGLANRIVGRWAKFHATGLPASHYGYPAETTRYVGIPVDERIKPVTKAKQVEFKKQLGLDKDKLVLLVAGGGMGAKTLNDLLLTMAPQLLHELPNLQIVNITGHIHEADLKRQYEGILKHEDRQRMSILGFTPQYYKYSGAADLVICRAGASTLAELAIQRKAAIIIPNPFLTGGHQLKNAEEFKKAGAVKILDNNISAPELMKVTVDLLKDSATRTRLAEKIGSMAHPEAADKLAKLLLEVATS